METKVDIHGITVGSETRKALQNFPFSVAPMHTELFHAIAEVKLAAARANHKAGTLPTEVSEAIQEGCRKVVDGEFDHLFMLPGIQGGAGTSLNMAVNEVVAHYATSLLFAKGHPVTVHPNDHVNSHQSTNDVNPTALKIVVIRLHKQLQTAISDLAESLDRRASEFSSIAKLGRTHLQDAVPTTLGEEFKAYAAICKRHLAYLSDQEKYLCDVNLGGTAIGNSIWTTPEYLEAIYPELCDVTGLELRSADNQMSQTSSASDLCSVSSAITNLFTDLSKIASDIHFMCSGPRGGLGEIKLQELQKGSSIMPGKINPIIPESVNQIYFYIFGLNQTIHLASTNANLELNVMFPVTAFSLITSMKLALEGITVFRTKCIESLEAVPENCAKHLNNSTALAAGLVDEIGYDAATVLVKESIATGIPFGELVSKTRSS
jgi:aspartate ammonia-lyase